MRDVENGWLIRYIHANVASFFFIFVYAHVGRNIYYGSFKTPRVLVWSIGVIILILMMAIAFLGYVLPYGQMSLWGATVITNLLSAIPIFGQDIVELIWGGFKIIEEPYNSDIVFKILLIAGKFINLNNSYSYNKFIAVKKLSTIKKPAEIKNKIYFEVSQRLNAGDLNFAMLVGLIEGDGWFSISKKGKYLMYEFGIEMNIRDVQLIYKIKNLLIIGVVKFRETKGRNKTVIFSVRNKSHLINLILPIFEKYPLLSNKQYDFLRFKDAILKDIKFYDDENYDPNYICPINPLNSVEKIISVSYFSSWLVGLIEAEGCFSIYKPLKDNSMVASFDISQTNGENIIQAISKYLSLTQKISRDKTNSFKIKVSSVRSIENIINFIQRAPVKLIGYKKLQYFLWIKNLRKIERYTKKINIPNKY